MTLHPVWASIGFAGLCVTTAASFLGVYAILLRDRWAEPLWFAATLGAALLVAGGLAHVAQPGGTHNSVAFILVLAGSIAMWVIARRYARPAPHGQRLPRWQAAAWAMNLPQAAQLGWLFVLPLAWALNSASSTPWLADQCMAMAEIDLRFSGRWVCDAARRVTTWGWMFGMIGSVVATGIMLVWLVFLVAPRGTRLRLVGFIVLAWILSTATTAALEADWDQEVSVEATGTLLAAFAISIVAGWAAFRPLRSRLSPPPAAPSDAPMPGSGGWRWRWVLPAGLLAMSLLLAGCVSAYVLVLRSNLRDTAPYLDAVARARTHPAVIERLGEPVDTGGAVAGAIRDDMPGVEGRVAALTIPLHGPRGQAKLQVQAMTIDGNWRFIELALETDGAREPLDLFDADERAAEDARREAMRARRAQDPAPRVCPDEEFDDVFEGT